ncbi:hypothetical protein [Lignipirellula cremea]|uniref:Uncharacterized protein n=1 Tax=Lignipirellula cremea TaxID=2528010 RepID=A0A518DV81_9BACT|nr:hypothetical protein [Lignipirellula cremea]QDU95737.1 hypothetical protein Pla8534_35540 [Lignipirellula cremea]
MDALHFCIALGPLAIYLLLLGMVNLSRRPFLTTGFRDTTALGVGICGFVVAGPMELFLPDATGFAYGWIVWALMLSFYALSLILIVLLLRPKLVIYNVKPDQLRPVLAQIVSELDKDARWAGDSLTLPQLGVQLHVETFRSLRNAQLVSSGPQQSYIGWRKLEVALRQALGQTISTPNRYGYFQIGFSIAAIVLIAWSLASDPTGVDQALTEMLRLG